MPSPLLVPTLFWCLGIGITAAFNPAPIWLIISGLAGILLGTLFRFRLPLLILLIIIAGALRLSISINKPASQLEQILARKESITQPCSGEILKILNADKDMYLVKLISVNKVKVNDKAVMYYAHKFLPGDRFKAISLITTRKPDPVLDKTSFYFAHRNKRTPIMLKTIYNLEFEQSAKKLNIERLRYHLLQKLDDKLGDAAPFGKALLLNDRTEDKDWIQQLIQGGLLHLIAISGLHVLFFYFIFVTLLNLFLSRRLSEIIFVILMLFYAGLCQWSAPVMRAIVMIVLYIMAKQMQRPVSPMQIICLSLLIITLFDPLQLFSIGLQLSYLCVITLLYLVPKRLTLRAGLSSWMRNLYRVSNTLIDTLLISTIVSVVMLPIMLFYFSRGSLNGIIGNLPGIPLVGILLPMTFVLMVIPSNWILFNWLMASFNLLHFIFQKWVLWTANLPFYVDTVILPFALMIVLYLIVTALTIRIKRGIKYRKLSYVLLIIAVPFLVYSQIPRTKPFTLTVFNVGLGDCTLVEYPRGQILMVDTGPKYFNSKTNTSKSWFGQRANVWQKHNKINKIDLLVLTHLDIDHSGGLVDVFKNMQVRNLLISNHTSQSKEWKQLMQSGILKEARVNVLTDTLSFDFAGSRISILHPDIDFNNSDDNDNSIVLRLDYKDFSALLTGDITSETEMLLVQEIPQKLDTDFLKVPHHGSKYSSSIPFIRAVSPNQACISTSLHNRFHFPHQETMKRYRSYGVEPQITGNGSVVVTIR